MNVKNYMQCFSVSDIVLLDERIASWYQYVTETPLIATGKNEFDCSERHCLPVTYQCDTEGNIDIETLTPVDTDADRYAVGTVVAQDSTAYTVKGMLVVVENTRPTRSVPRFDGEVTFVANLMGSAAPDDGIMAKLCRVAKSYYPITDALKNHPPLATFMSVNAVLDLSTQTVIDFQEVQEDYSMQDNKTSAVISEDPQAGALTFSAYIANGGFNVVGSQE